MDIISEKLINKFISGQRLSSDEFTFLEELFKNTDNRNEVIQWLEINWKESHPETVTLKFEQIRDKIRKNSLKQKIVRLYSTISKIAAIFILPLLFAAIYFYLNQDISYKHLTIATQKAEQTSIILPDGSKVWINVDTKLTYPANFGIQSREIQLSGEAYFEVAKNKDLPFSVISGNLKTTALGTKFSVSAYPWSEYKKSSLIEGSIEVSILDQKNKITSKILKPGQQLILENPTLSANIKTFENYTELGWLDDELVFELTGFDEVFHILEQWYNVEIHYEPDLFISETLTVRFNKYESLETALKVIGKANGFNYSIKDNHIEILK